MEKGNTIVVGGSQSGLAVSCWLSHYKQEHLVFEKARAGKAWRSGHRDSFTPASPNPLLQFPRFPYAGSDLDEFLTRPDFVQYLEDNARLIDASQRLGVEALSVARLENGRGFAVKTNSGDSQAQPVIIAAGAFYKPGIPPLSEHLARGSSIGPGPNPAL